MTATTTTACIRCGLPAEALIHTGTANTHAFAANYGEGQWLLTREDALRLGWELPAWVRQVEVFDRTTLVWLGSTELLDVRDLTRATVESMTVRVRPMRMIDPREPVEEQDPAWVEVAALTGHAAFEYLPADALRIAEAMIRAANQIQGGEPA